MSTERRNSQPQTEEVEAVDPKLLRRPPSWVLWAILALATPGGVGGVTSIIGTGINNSQLDEVHAETRLTRAEVTAMRAELTKVTEAVEELQSVPPQVSALEKAAAAQQARLDRLADDVVQLQLWRAEHEAREPRWSKGVE